MNGEHTFTKNHNCRSPGYAVAISWISEIWDEFDPTIIKESFDYCGITQNKMSGFHKQLQAFIENGLLEYVDDSDDADDFIGLNI
jgi:hypothetical protein